MVDNPQSPYSEGAAAPDALVVPPTEGDTGAVPPEGIPALPENSAEGPETAMVDTPQEFGRVEASAIAQPGPPPTGVASSETLIGAASSVATSEGVPANGAVLPPIQETVTDPNLTAAPAVQAAERSAPVKAEQAKDWNKIGGEAVNVQGNGPDLEDYLGHLTRQEN